MIMLRNVAKNKKTKKIVAFLGVALLYLILTFFHVQCLFKTFFGVPCPGCGMTRALGEILNGNFVKAFEYHPMIYFMPLVLWFIWKDGNVFRKPFFNKVLIFIFILGFLLCYIARFLGILVLV